MKKRGFTLSELMISLLVIGLIMAIMTPVISQLRPNVNKMLFKKAFLQTQQIVQKLLSDPEIYDKRYETTGFEGLCNVDTASGEVDYVYFCENFFENINTIDQTEGATAEHACANTDLSTVSFTTTDGIDWYMPKAVLCDDSGQYIRYISIDVNGADKLPNCSPEDGSCTDPDVFEIMIRRDGKIYLPDTYTNTQDYLIDESIE